MLGPRTTAVHATHLTDVDRTELGDTGTGVCLCPTTERDLADGIGPARALADAGSPLCLGSDSHAVIDLFEEARAVELDERLRTERRGHFAAAELLDAATAAGHAALGWPDAGTIAVGAARRPGHRRAGHGRAPPASTPAAARLRGDRRRRAARGRRRPGGRRATAGTCAVDVAGRAGARRSGGAVRERC